MIFRVFAMSFIYILATTLKVDIIPISDGEIVIQKVAHSHRLSTFR